MKKIIKNLKSKKVIAEDVNVPKNFLHYIENEEIAKNIPIWNFSDNNIWNEVHKSILQSFLSKCINLSRSKYISIISFNVGMRLNATEDEIIRLFRIHKMIKNKSFRIVQENITIAEDLGFDRRKILKHGYLLHNYPNYPKTVLRDFPNLAGADMRRAMFVYPKLVMASPVNIVKIYGTLKVSNVTYVSRLA